MSEQVCTYKGNRDEDLVAFLYNELPPGERRAFEAHVATCLVCHGELAALGSIRTQLQEWTPPDAFRSMTAGEPVTSRQRTGLWSAAREMPAWAQVAAAALIMGVSAGIANLDVDISRNGLSVRTGWSAPASAPRAEATNANVVSRDELMAFRTSMQRQINEIANLNQQTVRAANAARTQDLLRRMEGLVSESEKKQQTELALRLYALDNEVKTRRQADVVAINSVLGQYNAEVQRNRADINTLVERVVLQR
jgi:hypothetical protein